MLMPKSKKLAKLSLAIVLATLALSAGLSFAPLARADGGVQPMSLHCYVECVGCAPCTPNEAKCRCFSGGQEWFYCSWLGNDPICAD
jgi:hypothetical protein